MLPSFLQKLASRTKSHRKPRTPWALPSLENLDDRILPSVNATLKGGVLKVIADVQNGTSQVEILQSPDQITVEDTGTVVNGFPADQVQQIDFKYRELQHQHAHFDLTIPVSQSQMTLTGFNVGEVDLNLGVALTATATAMLPDGTAVRLAGAVDNQGNYDLTGAADISVDGFALPAATFELTNAGLAVMATTAIGENTVGLAGTVDNQGNDVLAATADLTMAGFVLPAASVRLDQNGLALAGPLMLPDGVQVHMAKILQAQDPLSLTGVTTLPIAGLSFTTAFTLTTSALTGAAGVILPGIGPVTVSGSLVPQGAIHWTGSNPITLGGQMIDSTFTLTDTSFSADGLVNFPGIGLVDLTGTVTPQGELTLGGIGHFAPNGFPIDAAFILNANGMAISAMPTLPAVGPVEFAGVVDSQGYFSVTADTPFTVAGLSVVGTFTLSNANLTAAAGLALPVLGPVSLPAGPISSQGLFNLAAPLGNVTLFGFPMTNTTVTLTNTTLGISGDVNVHLDQQMVAVHFTGTAYPDGTLQLAGTAAANFVGWATASATFTLTNSGLAVVGDVNVKLDAATVMVHFNGTAQPAGAFQLTGTAAASFVGWTTASAAFTLTNNGLAIVGDVHVNLDVAAVTVHFTGSAQPSGAFQLTGTAAASFGNWSTSSAAFTLTNGGLMIVADVGVKIDQATVTVHVTGSSQPAGSFRLTGTAAATYAGWGAGTTTTFTLTSGPAVGLMVSNMIPVQLGQTTVNVQYAGVIYPDGTYQLTGTAMATFGGWSTGNGMATFTLNNAGLSIMGGIDVTIGQQPIHIDFMGSAHLDRTYSLTGMVNAPSFAGWTGHGNATFTLSNAGMGIVVDVYVTIDATTYHVHFMGSTAPNGQFVLMGMITDNNPNFQNFVMLNAVFTLNNAGLHVTGNINAQIDTYTAQVDFIGDLTLGTNGQPQYSLAGTIHGGGNTQFGNFSMPHALFGLDNQHGLTVAGDITVQQGNTSSALVSFQGAIQPNHKYSLSGTAHADSRGNFNGWASLDATYHIDNTGTMPNIMMVGGSIVAVLNASPVSVTVTIDFTGQIDPIGRHFTLMGTARTAPLLDGFLVASAGFKVDDQNGMTLSGQVNLGDNLPGFPIVTFNGWVHTDHHYQINGQGPGFNFLNFVTSGSQFTLSDSGDTVNFNILNVLNSFSVYLHGTFSKTQLSLTGGHSISFIGFPVADASFTVAKTGSVYSLTVTSYVNVFVATVYFTGTIQSNGQFSLSGSNAANFAGFIGANIGFTLSNSGLVAYGQVDCKVATITVSMTVSNTGAFQFTLNTRLSFAGFVASSGTLTLNNGGVTVSATLDTAVMSFRMGVSGVINRDGSFRFMAHFGFSFGAVSAGLDLTLTNTGFTASAHADVDVTANVGVTIWGVHYGATVGVRGHLDVNFAIGLNGTFSASGNFQMCAYAGIGGCFSVGFSIDNHSFCIRTSSIGFKLWGYGFQPFGDYCRSY